MLCAWNDITSCVWPGLRSVWSLRGATRHLQHPLPLPVLHPVAAAGRTVYTAHGMNCIPNQPLCSLSSCLMWFLCGPWSGGCSLITYSGSDSSPAALWDSGSAAHVVPTLPALHLPQDRWRSDGHPRHHRHHHDHMTHTHTCCLCFRAAGLPGRTQHGSHPAHSQRCAWSDAEHHGEEFGGSADPVTVRRCDASPCFLSALFLLLRFSVSFFVYLYFDDGVTGCWRWCALCTNMLFSVNILE